MLELFFLTEKQFAEKVRPKEWELIFQTMRLGTALALQLSGGSKEVVARLFISERSSNAANLEIIGFCREETGQELLLDTWVQTLTSTWRGLCTTYPELKRTFGYDVAVWPIMVKLKDPAFATRG